MAVWHSIKSAFLKNELPCGFTSTKNSTWLYSSCLYIQRFTWNNLQVFYRALWSAFCSSSVCCLPQLDFRVSFPFWSWPPSMLNNTEGEDWEVLWHSRLWLVVTDCGIDSISLLNVFHLYNTKYNHETPKDSDNYGQSSK